MLVLVSLRCGPVVDFTTLHPFDFDRNHFNFLVCVLLFFVNEVLFNIMQYYAVFVSTIGLVFLLLMAFLYY